MIKQQMGVYKMKGNFFENKSGNGLWRKVGIGAVSFLLLAGGIWYGKNVYYYRDHFFENTTINQLQCDNLTEEEAEDQVKKQVEDYELHLQFRGGDTEKISGKSIDYQFVSDGGIGKILEEQNEFFWISGFFKEREYQVKENISFDEEKLNRELEQLKVMEQSDWEKPKDAYVTFKKDKFVIVDEVEGTTLNEKALKKEVCKTVHQRKESFSAQDEKVYVTPQVTKESEALVKECKQLNELAAVTVTYQLPKGELVLDGNDLRKWLSVDKKGNYYNDAEKFDKNLNKFVKKLAKKVDTLGKARPFHTTSGLDVTVQGGNYGWKIDQKKERKTLRKNIKEMKNISREPVYSSREKYKKNHGLGSTYIEVNLTEQHLYYYKKGKIVVDSPIVSGRMTRSRFTPPGVYFLTYKQRDRVLRGRPLPDGTPSYESPVSFWMPFNGGIGLHDASWRGSFGGKIYKYSGSHGCINMPYSNAKKVYQLIDKDVPIVCVYNEGYSLHG